VKMAILQKAIYMLKAILIKIFLHRN
jgi:hypothetical protein